MEHRNYKDGILKILSLPATEVKFGLKNALLGVGCSLKSQADYEACYEITKDVLLENATSPEDVAEYLNVLELGFSYSK